MTGAILNAGGILLGGAVGLTRKTPLSVATQSFWKLCLGLATIYYGLQLVWLSVGGPFLHVIRQAALALLAVLIGKWAGRLLRFQKASNRLGQLARGRLDRSGPTQRSRFTDGFTACAILFCAAPLGILGAVQDGLTGYFYPLAVKAVMDGLAMLSFAGMFGAGSLLAALPVFAFQAAITLACTQYLEPCLRMHGLVDSVNAVGGLIVCTTGLVIFDVKKVELADYLPSLAIAPVLTWMLR